MSPSQGDGGSRSAQQPQVPTPGDSRASAADPSPRAPAVGSSVRGSFLQHGAGWVAALAAVAGVAVTAAVGLGDSGSRSAPAESSTPTAAVTPAPATPIASAAPTFATPVATLGPFGPVLPDAANGADVVASIVAPDLPAGDPHRLIAMGPAEGLSLEVPAAWSDGSIGDAWLHTNDEEIGVAAFFGPSERDFYRDTLETNGVFAGGSADVEKPVDELTQDLFELYWRECTIGGRGHWDDGTFAGNYEIYGPCGDEAIRIIGLVARDEASGATIAIDLHVTTRADLAIAANLIDSVHFEPPRAGGDRALP